ncbi:MAG: hypothetical protein HZA72_02290, partial [Candidatus Omnitrophica bacterium]|nr:hypothetical protein [Candidatus Omnitrophota bacterium]
MPIFSYVAKDSQGRSVKSRAFAASEQELKTRLARKHLFIISMEEKKELTRRFIFFKQKIKTADLVLFCKQLATLLKGGVPIIKGVDSIVSELKSPLFRQALG